MDDVPGKNDKNNPDTINLTRLAKTCKYNLNTSMRSHSTVSCVGEFPPARPVTSDTVSCAGEFPPARPVISDKEPSTGEEHHLPEGWRGSSPPTTGEHHPAPRLEHQPIQVLCGNRPDQPARGLEREARVLRTVRRSNKHLVAAQLPTVFVTNHRSLFPKFHNFVEVMKTLGLTLGLHSEIWEDRENKEHSNRIEEALELEGIKYISNPRPNRRGGGAAITLIEGEFTLTRLDVITPPSLEVVWGLVKPKVPTTTFKGIIVCSFYSVPHSRTKTKLIEHITLTYTELKARHRDCLFLMGGDKNDLDIGKLLGISPTFHQHTAPNQHTATKTLMS